MTRDEREDVALLLGVFFLLAFGYVVGQAAGYSLFVARFGATDLPFAFLTMPLFGVLLGWLNVRGARRLSLDRLLLANVVAMIVISVLVRVGIAGEGAGWVKFVLPTWDAGVNNLNNLVVWGATARLFDVGQAKRLGPVVSAGRSLALVCGGLLVPVVVSLVGTRNLYLVQAVCFALALAVLARLASRRGDHLRGVSATGAPAAAPTGDSARAYLRSVFLVVFVSMLSYVLVRNVFLDRGAARFPDTADYAATIGLLNAAQGVLTLVSALFLAGRFLGRFGVRSGLLALPVALVVVYVPLAAVDLEGGVQFVLAAAGFVVCGALMFSVRTPSIQLLYQPLDASVRSAAVARSEGVIEPIALGCAALALLIVTRVAELGARGMAAAVAIAGLLLVVAAVRAFAGYRGALREVLSRRWLRGGTLDLADLATRAALVERAVHGDVDEVVVAIGLLEEGGHDVASVLATLLASDRPGVRSYALVRLLERGDVVSGPALAAVLDRETDPEARAVAARLVARQGRSPQAVRALDDVDPRVRHGALCGLLETADAEGRRIGTARLDALAVSDDPSDRHAAADAIAVAGGPATAPVVTTLLHDLDREVARAALAAAGRVRAPQLLPVVVSALADPRRVRPAARAASAFGAAAVPPLVDALRRPGATASVRQVVRAIARVDDERAEAALLALLVSPAAIVREHAARALEKRGRRLGLDQIGAATRREAEIVAARLGALVALGGSGDAHPGRRAVGVVLEASLWDAVRQGRDQQLRLLRILGATPQPIDLERAVASMDPRRQAYAVEVVETTVPQPMRSWIAPLLLLDATSDELLARLPEDLRGRSRDDRSAALTGLVLGAEGWLSRLALAATTRPEDDGEDRMISIIDRVVFLRSVDLFAGLPAETVGDLAAMTEEVRLDAGQTLFEQGDTGSSMFVVVEGRMRIHADGHTIDERGQRAVLGELALLDAEPRSASATALEPVLLLRIEQEPFFELMTDRPEVLRRMLHSVIATLRSRLADVAHLQRRLDAVGATSRSPDGSTGSVAP